MWSSRMNTFVKTFLVFFIFNQFLTSAGTEVCKISTRNRRDAPYIISVGSCDPTNIKILRADEHGHGHGRHAEEDINPISDAEEIALEGRTSFYGLVTKMLEHVQARVSKSVQRASRIVEERRIASALRGSSRKKRVLDLLDFSKFKNLLADQ